MKCPIISAGYKVIVFDTESNTTTGSLTSWQAAPVLQYEQGKEYSITEEDAAFFRVPLSKGNTKIGLKHFHQWIVKNFEENDKIAIYVHNFKWDIQFLLNYLMKDLNYTYADKLEDNKFTMLITYLGMVFTLEYVYEGRELRFIDSLKILNFTLKDAGKSYNTKYKKVDGEDYDGYLSTQYIVNDVLCLSELIAIQMTQGFTPKIISTAGLCLDDYKHKLMESKLGQSIIQAELDRIDKLPDEVIAKRVDKYRQNKIKKAVKQATKDKYQNMDYDILKEYVIKDMKSKVKTKDFVYRSLFPQIDDLAKHPIDTSEHDFISLDTYCRQAYKGGLTYCNPTTKGKIFISRWFYDNFKDDPELIKVLQLPKDRYEVVDTIYHYDVHSLYPSKCIYGYGPLNTFPIGKPVLKWGCPDTRLIDKVLNNKAHFIIRFKCKFDIKEGRFPSIQIKGDFHNPTEWLKTSRLFIGSSTTDDHHIIDRASVLSLTDVEFFDFIDRYNIRDIEWIDYAVFAHVATGYDLFNDYMNFYYQEKQKNKGNFVLYNMDKIKINGLTGKFGTNPHGYRKVPHLRSDGVIELKTSKTYIDTDGVEKLLRKDSEYVPVVAWITAYGRLTLLDAMDDAGDDLEAGTQYITGDTDSEFVAANLNFKPNLGVSDNDMNTFGREHTFKKDGKEIDQIAMFVSSGQKCYLVYMLNKEKGYFKFGYDIKVAGMTEKQKKEFVQQSEQPIIDFANEDIKVKGGKLINLPTIDGAVLVDTDFVKSSKTYNIKQDKVDKADENIYSMTMFKARFDFDMDFRSKMRKYIRECDDNLKLINDKLGSGYHITAEMLAYAYFN